MKFIRSLILQEQKVSPILQVPTHSQILQGQVDKKIISYYLLFFCLASFDVAVKHAKVFPVNWVVFYYVAIFGFLSFRIILDSFETKNKFQRLILWGLVTLPIGRVFLNIFAINQSREGYNAITSNLYVDVLQWLILIVSLIIISWVNSTR